MTRRRLNPHRRSRDKSLWPSGDELREARQRADISAGDLAKRLRWSRASLYEYERAERVDPEYAAVILAALGAEAPRSPIALELVASGGCLPECVDGLTPVIPLVQHAWWDYRVTVSGFTFPTLYRVHANRAAPGDAHWHEVPYGGPIERWIFGDLQDRVSMLTESVVTAADPWPGSGFDPAAYRSVAPWKFWPPLKETR